MPSGNCNVVVPAMVYWWRFTDIVTTQWKPYVRTGNCFSRTTSLLWLGNHRMVLAFAAGGTLPAQQSSSWSTQTIHQDSALTVDHSFVFLGQMREHHDYEVVRSSNSNGHACVNTTDEQIPVFSSADNSLPTCNGLCSVNTVISPKISTR